MPLTTMLFSFQGRMRRSHWWAIRIVVTVVVVVLLLVCAGVLGAVAHETESKAASGIVLIVIGLPTAVTYLWIYLATSVKRLHDQDLTGWITPLFFVPYIGGFASLVVLGCLDGTRGPNKFGPSEKYPYSVAETFS